MARTLVPNLRTALDREEHEPAIRISSENIEGSFPFSGSALNESDVQTFKPYMIKHSNGNIIVAMREKVLGANYDEFVFVSIDKTTNIITKFVVDGMKTGISTNYHIDAIALMELPFGLVGVVIARYWNGTTGSIYQATLSATGEVIATPTLITTYPREATGLYGLTGLSIAGINFATYYTVYCYTTATDTVLNKITSTDWTNWTGPTAITTGLTTAGRKFEGAFIFQASNLDCFIMLSYTDTIINDVLIGNIYSILSTDHGANWGAPSARTAYVDPGSSAYGPVLAQKSDGELFLVFYERQNVLTLGESSVGWQDSGSGFGICPIGFSVRNIYYNPSTGHLTCSYGSTSMKTGTHGLCGVLVIDVDSWGIIDNFNSESTPAINELFAGTSLYYAPSEKCQEYAQGSKFITAVMSGVGVAAIMLLDVEERSLQHIQIIPTAESTTFDSYNLSELTTIVKEASSYPNSTLPYFRGVVLNEPNADRIYILASNESFFHKSYNILWIELSDLTSIQDGSFHSGATWESNELYQLYYIRVYDNDDLIVIGSGGALQGGAISLITKTTPAILHEWTTSLTMGFPYYGCHDGRPTYANGHVYFGIKYKSGGSYSNQRGLCDINVSSNTTNFIRPPWATEDNYDLIGTYFVDALRNNLWIAPYKTEEIGTPNSYVIAVRYGLVSGEWRTYNRLLIPGIPNVYTASAGQNIAMDVEGGNLFIGLGVSDDLPSGSRGIVRFNVSSSFTQCKYLTATKSTVWDWDLFADVADFVLSSFSMDPTTIVDDDNVIWCFWDEFDPENGIYVPYWDRNLGETILDSYLTDQVVIHWEVKNSNTLEFTLTNGNLFDPENSYSLLKDIVKKGRKITVKMGEYYNGFSYLENQGVFIVVSSKLSYGLKKYPTIQVQAESQNTFWKDQHIIVSPLYTSSPLAMITDLLTSYGNLDVGDYIVPVFDNTHDVQHQFVDVMLMDALETILDHWFYSVYDDLDGVSTFKKVDLNRIVDHIYPTNKKIIDFTPDDSFSDFTNAVRVIGESLDFIDVMYGEELIDTLSGSVGWWENKQTRTVRYGKEGVDRKCRNPRLKITQSISYQGPMMDMLGGSTGTESIDTIDPNELFCTIKIDIPSLTGAIVISVIAVLAAGTMALTCDWSFGCGVALMAAMIAIVFCFYILMAVANYQYEIWANPMGEEKTSIQYLAQDTDFQRSLKGRIVKRDIDDPFCYTLSECMRVAEGNLALVTAQRRRIKFVKVADMQDELLDKIRVNHPYSGESVDVVITSLTRTYKKGLDNTSGFFDAIEGWRIV
jgi:hypothetical protein